MQIPRRIGGEKTGVRSERGVLKISSDNDPVGRPSKPSAIHTSHASRCHTARRPFSDASAGARASILTSPRKAFTARARHSKIAAYSSPLCSCVEIRACIVMSLTFAPVERDARDGARWSYSRKSDIVDFDQTRTRAVDRDSSTHKREPS